MLSDSPSHRSLSSMVEAQAVSPAFSGTRPSPSIVASTSRLAGSLGLGPTLRARILTSSPSLFRVALQRRLRSPLWDHDSACGMCGEVSHRWGDHALSCCCGGDRVLRHNAVRDVVCSAVAEFTSVSLVSPGGTFLDHDPSSSPLPPAAPGRRPADIWVPRGVSGFAEAWDFSVSSLLRNSHLSSATRSVADVFHEMEARRRAFQDTASMVAERGATFCPLVLEPAGEGGPKPSGRLWLGLPPSPAPPPLICSGTPASGLHSASAAPFTGKTRVCQRVIWFRSVTRSLPPVGDHWLCTSGVLALFVVSFRLLFAWSLSLSAGCAGVSLRRLLLAHRVVFVQPVHKSVCVCARMLPSRPLVFSTFLLSHLIHGSNSGVLVVPTALTTRLPLAAVSWCLGCSSGNVLEGTVVYVCPVCSPCALALPGASLVTGFGYADDPEVRVRLLLFVALRA